MQKYSVESVSFQRNCETCPYSATPHRITYNVPVKIITIILPRIYLFLLLQIFRRPIKNQKFERLLRIIIARVINFANHNFPIP